MSVAIVAIAALAAAPSAIAAGASMVRDIDPGSASGVPGPDASPSVTSMAGTLFFPADDGAHGVELWRSDGTAAGTRLVRDIHPGAGSSGIWDLTVHAGTLFFRADDGTHGSELWRSDGTAAGTRMVRDINPGAGSSTPLLPRERRREALLQRQRRHPRHGTVEFRRHRRGNKARARHQPGQLPAGVLSRLPD